MDQHMQFGIPSTISEIQVSYHNTILLENCTQVTASIEAERVLRLLWDNDTIEYKEQFYALFFSKKNDLLGYHIHSIGGVLRTVVDVKQILGIAVKSNACSIVLSHNHPSGNCIPSQADIALTKKIVNGAALLDISVLDHIIMTKEPFYSFADDGVLSIVSSD